MSRIPDAVLDEIKDKISISEVVSEYVKLNSKGGQLWGLCPFHEEKSPSFTVHDDKGFYTVSAVGKAGPCSTSSWISRILVSSMR